MRAVREDLYVIGGTAGTNSEDGVTLGNLWAINLDSAKGAIGSLLWNITFTPPSSAGNRTISMGTVDPEDGVFLFSCTQTRQWWCYNLQTGQLLWGPSSPEIPWNYYGMSNTIYQGNLYSYGSGMTAAELVCYDIKTGVIKWKFVPAQEGFESPYGDYPLSVACIADGKIYFYSTEHSPTQPFWRGSYVRCIDATTGKEIWKINHHGRVYVADGYLVGLNMYDNQIYCYGMGPTETTVTADSVTQGESVLIQGTVMDIAAGTTQTEQAARFPKGVPAMSDENMTAWMQYVYMQQPKPTDAVGVKVHVTAIDSNGNYQDIGTVTSNIQGNFAIDWKPPVPGLYTVTATFEGSKAYYGSEAGTSFEVQPKATAAPAVVTPAPTQPSVTATSLQPTNAPTVAPTPSPAIIPPTSAAPNVTYIAIGAVVIIIIAVAAAFILRHRK
jgi:outer membrane protein assembly factor BamB